MVTVIYSSYWILNARVSLRVGDVACTTGEKSWKVHQEKRHVVSLVDFEVKDQVKDQVKDHVSTEPTSGRIASPLSRMASPLFADVLNRGA